MINVFDYTNFSTIFIIGLLLGSFLNVVIHRLPKSQSIISPSSYCPSCSAKLKWYENIPIISYIFLKGKCAHCKSAISIQYPLIELITGLLLFIVVHFSDNTLQLITFSLLSFSFLALSIIDFKNYILPDALIIFSSIICIIYFGVVEQVDVLMRFYYAILTGSGMFVLRMLTTKIYKKETFGLGDVKLSALIGFIIGYWDAFIGIFLGFILAAIIFTFLIVTKIQKKEAYLPFGPYLIFGLLFYLLFGEEIVRWYISFFI